MSAIDPTPARRGDAVQLSRLARRWVEAGLEPVWTDARIERRRRADDGAVWVLRRGDGLVGGAIVRFEDRDARLELLVVATDARRAGHGRCLLHACERSAVDAGLPRLVLEVRAGNAGGQAFYRALGYREHARLAGYYAGIEDALRYGRDLSVAREPRIEPL